MDVLREGLLKIDPGLLLWSIITFVILLLILWKTAWKPIIKALDNRADKIMRDIETAEKSRSESERVLKEHRLMLDKAGEEVSQLIEKSRLDAESIKNSILAKAKTEADDIFEKANRDILLAKDVALEELKGEIAELSVKIAEKIISKSLKPEDHEDIVENILNKIKTI